MDKLTIPNMRKMFVPDPGYMLFEVDLKGADAQVVAWDSEDELLMQAFREGLDVHAFNADTMDEPDWRAVRGLSKDDPKRREVRDAYKSAIHGTNYLGTPKAIAHHPRVRWTVHRAEQFQKKWFSLHPKIQLWHKRIEADLATTRTVRNAFGYRRIFFDRLDQCLTNAVAWIPQSSVAINCFKGALAVRRAQKAGEFDPDLQFLIQVHDSWLGQVPLNKTHLIRQMQPLLHITTPYPDPLVIPWDLKTSTISWGDCKGTSWDSLPLAA